MKRLILIFIAITTVTALTYGQRTITGTVTSDDGERLIGANVLVRGS